MITVKERLQQHRQLLTRLNAIRQELDYINQTYGDIMSPAYSDIPKNPNGGQSSPLETVTRKIELEEMAELKEREITEDWAELEGYVNELNPTESLIVYLRYYHGAEWDDICTHMYHKRDDFDIEFEKYMNRIYKIHGKALLFLSEILI